MDRTKRRLAASIVVLALLAAILTAGALAVFTDTQSVGANTFSTGDVDISTSPASALVTFSGMLPGDQVTAPITVTNDGSADLRYAITSTTTENVLAGQLDLTVKSGVATCTDAGFGASGTVIYGGADLGSTTGVNVVGDPAQGAQAGDRALVAAASETLCFNVTLPLSTGNAFANLTSTATFAFAAEQTRNNP
jgi:predicted ribosomally synthesized peptide with SipW-like signal peptide